MEPRPIDIPASGVRSLVPKLVARIEEVERLRAEATTAREAESRSRRDLAQAVEDDRQAMADRARGKAGEVKPAVPKAHERLARAEAKAAALDQAAADATRELLAEVERERGVAVERVDAERERCQEAMVRTVRKLSELEVERREIMALAGWLANPSAYAPGKYRDHSLGMTKQSGDHYRLDEVIAAIANALTAPVERDEGKVAAE